MNMVRVITDYLDRTASRLGDKTAYTDDRRSVTWKEIREESRRVGQALVNAGLFKKPVAIFIGKKIECIAAVFGVAYSGNFYTVIDTDMPEERIRKIISTLQPAAVIAEEGMHVPDGICGADAEIFYYADMQRVKPDDSVLFRTGKKILSTDVLYVLFTSGSTGMPKGVVTPHRAVICYMEALTDAFDFNSSDVLAAQAPFYFVISIVDIFIPACTGASMCIVPRQNFMFPALLMKYLSEHHVTTMYWVPSALTIIANLNAFHMADTLYIRRLMFGGEVMPVKSLNRWMEALPDAEFVNCYGPTECTDNCTYYVVDRKFKDNETLPIGGPFNNDEVLVLNDQNERVKGSEVGELCIRSMSLTYGYYNDPEKTNAVYVQNPLNTAYPEKIYRTGDLVHYNAQGELLFDGRRDFQIKHMGYRIELGEIEANVSSVEGIDECCCLYDGHRQMIILYYTGSVDDDMLTEELKKLLPDYMLPNKKIRLETMPHNLNGKIDRAKLRGGRAPNERLNECTTRPGTQRHGY